MAVSAVLPSEQWSCIYGARGTIDLLRDLGIPAKPVKVRATIGDREFWDGLSFDPPILQGRCEILGRVPAQLDEVVTERRNVDGYWGHVVVRARFDGAYWLLDPSLPQVRVARGDLNMKPLILRLQSNWPNERSQLAVWLTPTWAVEYAHDPDAADFTSAPAWSDAEWRASMSRRVNDMLTR